MTVGIQSLFHYRGFSSSSLRLRARIMQGCRRRVADGLLSSDSDLAGYSQPSNDPISSRTRKRKVAASTGSSSAANQQGKPSQSVDSNIKPPSAAKKLKKGAKSGGVSDDSQFTSKADDKSLHKKSVGSKGTTVKVSASDTSVQKGQTSKKTVSAKPKATKTTGDRDIDKSEVQKEVGQVKPPETKKGKTKQKGSSKKGKTKMAKNYETPMEVDDGFIPKLPSPNQSATSPIQEEEDMCAVCMCPPENPKTLDKCKHTFCTECIDQCFAKMNPMCPICGTAYGDITGNMPLGTMQTFIDKHTLLPGYERYGAILIQYDFPDGIQTKEHPHPGKQYYGTHRVAFLPNNPEGQKVCALLRRAFDSRLSFTVGRSATTGLDDQVIWNDVHHKTRVHGGPTAFGYPDPTYLSRVQEELAAKGIR